MKLWQALLDNWSKLTFQDRYPEITPLIRAYRVLEETLELCQAEGVSLDDIATITKQVYDKPVGIPSQELGGVMTCLLSYAELRGLDLEECLQTEYMRMCDPVIMEKVRKRNLDGDKIGFKKSGDPIPAVATESFLHPASLFPGDRLSLFGRVLNNGISSFEIVTADGTTVLIKYPKVGKANSGWVRPDLPVDEPIIVVATVTSRYANEVLTLEYATHEIPKFSRE